MSSPPRASLFVRPRFLFTFGLLVAAPLAGCDGAADSGPQTSPNVSDDAVYSQNGLYAINGLTASNGLAASNGLVASNGLAASNGLLTTSGVAALSSLKSTTPLINTTDGRSTLSYLVRCALPAGHSVTLKDQLGTSYTFGGGIGLTPQWEKGACDNDCQQQISACMMAHVNTSGRHIALWIVSDNPALGWGLSANYPYQEGSFFGNIFTSPPQAYYCNGQGYDLAVVPGRLGANQVGAPYTDPFGANAACKSYCTTPPGPDGGNGYSSCKTFKHVITVYRDWDPSTPYKICSRATGACLTASAGEAVTLEPDSGGTNQQFELTRINPSQYRVCSVANGLCVAPAAVAVAGLRQGPYTGATNQTWTIAPRDGAYGFYFACSAQGGLCAAVGGSPGAIENDPYKNVAGQQWSITMAQ